MSIANIFKISYYFDNSMGYSFSGSWIILGFLVVLLFATIVIGARLRKNKKLPPSKKFLINSWIGLGYLLSVVGLVLLFFRYQGLPYLGWRLWPTMLLITVIVKSIILIHYQKKHLPKKDAERQDRISKQYYFKRRKRK